jgi:hypothetical protein
MHSETGGKKMDGTVPAMVEIGNMLHISKLIEKDNSESDFHLDMHTVMSGAISKAVTYLCIRLYSIY